MALRTNGAIKTKMLIMRPDQPHETQECELPREPGYDRLRVLLRPLLDGAELEHVYVLADFNGGTSYRRCDMFVDEFGAINRLPRNEAATEIYRRAYLRARSRQQQLIDPEQLAYIHGPAVLFDRIVWF
jgi:hypothetical protein